MLQQLKADQTSLRGVDYEKSGIPRGKGFVSDLSGMFIKIECHEEELNRTMQRAEHVYSLIKRSLDDLNDPRGAYVLSLRHISRRSWKEIADALGLASESRTREIYVKALDQLNIPEGIKKMGGNEDEQEYS